MAVSGGADVEFHVVDGAGDGVHDGGEGVFGLAGAVGDDRDAAAGGE